MSFLSEKQLQELLVDALQTETFLSLIKNQDEVDDHLSLENNSRFIPGFQIDFQLRTLYCRKAKEVLDSFGLYDIITGDKIKNISIQKDTKNKKERLFPDILTAHPEQSRFSILELKKDVQTEREAVTELFAYAIELKNHLPNIADTDINLVIISTHFNTLLDHSISSIVLGTKFNILALKAGINDGKLTLDLHIPDSWTDIWQNTLPEYAFSSVSLAPYLYDKKKEKEIPDKAFLFEIIDDLIAFNGAKNNSHGFCIIWQNITGFESSAEFCISLYQINPFVFLQSSIDKKFILNTNQPLSQYLIEHFEDNIYNQPDSLMNIAAEVKMFLDQYYSTHYEDFSSWTSHMYPESNFRSQALPISFNSWGNIGDYIRHYFFHPSLKSGFFSKQQLNSPLFYKDPVFGIELINRISGNTLFEDGVYNFSSLFNYARQLRELLNVSGWYLDSKKAGKRFELLEPKLFYAVLDVLASTREIQYRANYIDVKLKSPKPLRINPYGVEDSAVENITEQCQWFVDEFLANNPIHQQFFSGAINWSVLFMNEGQTKHETFEKEITKQLVSFVKLHLFSIVHAEVIGKSSFYGERLFHLLEPLLGKAKGIKKLRSKKRLYEVITAMDERLIGDYFESSFLPLLDLVYSEVFHPLVPFGDVTFITKDWKKLQLQLVKRFEEGHRYGAIILDANGNLSVGVMSQEYHLLKPIENPEEEVYVLRNESGFGIATMVTWDAVKSGAAFE
jgi:hypothetical protein